MPHACLFCGQNIEACIAWHICEKETRFTKYLIKVNICCCQFEGERQHLSPDPVPYSFKKISVTGPLKDMPRI